MVKFHGSIPENEIKDFSEYIKLHPEILDYLKDGKIKEVYDAMNESFYESLMTEILYASGTNIFNYLDYVPAFAFWESSLEEVEIPRHITKIETNAFAYCGNLYKVTFEKGSRLDSVGTYAFKSCHNLTGEIRLPDSLTKIEGNAFDYTGVKALNIPLNAKVVSKGEVPIIYRGVD